MEEPSDPINSRNMIKEAWIKLADDKGVIHALRTLVNEEVRSAVVSAKEWGEFKVINFGKSRLCQSYDVLDGWSLELSAAHHQVLQCYQSQWDGTSDMKFASSIM